jgi:hypothetical protein
MKIFNQLLNEALSAQVNTDYTRFLVEKQYALTKETARILLEQDEDEDGDGAPDVPFTRTYKGNKIYVHLDVGGRREIQVVDSLDAAKNLARNYGTGIAYDNSGNELDLNEALEDGVDRDYTSSFRPQKRDRTKSPLSAKMSKTYETLRAKLEKDIAANVADITDKEEQIVGKGKGNAESIKNSAFWKAVYDDPSLASVLDVEEYEKSGFKADEPLNIRKVGGHTYVPSREMDLSDLKPASRPYASGEAVGPVNPEDVPDVKFIAPAHPSFEQKGGVEQAATKAGRWFEKPENIKTALSMGIGVGGALGLARAGLSAIPKVGPSIAPWLIGAGEVGLGGLYGMHLKQGIESEIEQAEKGKGVTVGQATAGQAAAELPVAAAGASVGGGVFKPRTPRPAELVEPKTKVAKPESPKTDTSARWDVPGTKDYSAILRQQRERFTGDPSLEPASVAMLRELPTSYGRESALAAKFKIGKDKVSMGEMTPGERINTWRNLFRFGPKGASKKTPMSALDKFELVNPLKAKPETFVEPQTPLAPEASSSGTAITLPRGFRGRPPNFVGFPFTPPAALPKRPSEFESPADYQRSKEENLGRALTDKEAKASAEEFAKDLRQVEASRVSDRSTLFGDRGPVAMSSTGTPSRASVIARIQQSPVTKAAGVMASVPSVADMAAREASTIPAIVARALETTRTPAEPAGVLRTAYRELKVPEVKTGKPIEAPKIEAPSSKNIPAGYGLMNQPADISQFPDDEPVSYELMNQPMELPPSSDEEKTDSPVAVPANRPKALPQPSATPSTEAPTASQQSLLNAIKSARKNIKLVSAKPSETPEAIPDRSMDSVESARAAASWRAPEKSTISVGTSGKPSGSDGVALQPPKVETLKPTKDEIKSFADLFKYQVGGDVPLDRSMDDIESARSNIKWPTPPDRSMDAIEAARAASSWKAPEKSTVSFGTSSKPTGAGAPALSQPKIDVQKPSKEDTKKFADLFKYEIGGTSLPPDRSMDDVEAARSRVSWATPPDRSMDEIEATRAQAKWPTPPDRSMDDIEAARAQAKWAASPDRSMDEIEAARAQAKWVNDSTKAEAPKKEASKEVADDSQNQNQISGVSDSILTVAPVVQRILNQIRQSVSGNTNRGTPNRKISRSEPPTPKAGGIPFGGSDVTGTEPAESTSASKPGPDNWDLFMKQIYGKQAATLTK